MATWRCMSRIAKAVLTLAALGLLASAAIFEASRSQFRHQEPSVSVDAAVVEVAPSAKTAKAYFILRTNNDPTKLVGVSTPATEAVQLRTKSSNGDRLLRDGEATFDPARPLIFSKGGSYALLFGLDAKAGERTPLTFHVEPAKSITLNVQVVAEQ